MHPRISTLGTAMFAVILLTSAAFPWETDDAKPEVTERVARINFVAGDVQIRRDGVDMWERVDLNLPVVEGDEIVTGADSKVEIQLSSGSYIWLDSNSDLRVPALTQNGMALSLVKGTVAARVTKFEPDNEYLEIDAPGMTVAVKSKGDYRIDAGDDNSEAVKVTVNDGGEARVYSTDSGFTVKSGRMASLALSGPDQGEWETGDADAFADDFAGWITDRESTIDRLLANADYGKYYDDDIYGAEDLSSNGNWQYTRDYGYLWTPYDSAIRSYAGWSPYRYGSWRWVPPYGWTWVNDEPWGWATYHYGRWISYGGRWAWSPYGYYRSNRSWWYPALVVIRVIDRNVCWYPLGYRQPYYDYNSGYHDWVGNRSWRRRHDNDGDRDRWRQRPRDGQVAGGATPSPTPRIPKPMGKIFPIGKRPPLDDNVPATGVVMLPKDDFGTGKQRGITPSPVIRKGILARLKQQSPDTLKLPDYRAVQPRLGKGIAVTPSSRIIRALPTRPIGVTDRRADAPTDLDLDRSRIFGNRQPKARQPQPGEPGPGVFNRTVPRDTGAITRPARPKSTTLDNESRPRPIRQTPRIVAPIDENQNTAPAQSQRRKLDPPTASDAPRRSLPTPPKQEVPRIIVPRQQEPRIIEPPRNEAPPTYRQKRETPPPSPQPRRDPPPRLTQPSPARQEPRRDPPQQRSQPVQRSQPPPKTERPPERSVPDRPAPVRKKDT